MTKTDAPLTNAIPTVNVPTTLLIASATSQTLNALSTRLTQPEMQLLIQSTPILLSSLQLIKLILMEIQFQEASVVINLLAMLEQRALTLAIQLQSTLTLATELQLLALLHLAKTPFADLLDGPQQTI
jgi:hypothetical protein